MRHDVLALRNRNLRDLLTEARAFVIEHGSVQESARGKTYSLNLIELVWENPDRSEDAYWQWVQAEVEQYLDIFVEDKPDNRPEVSANCGRIVFPYTYAARSRFRDSGWGYVAAVMDATRAMTSDPSELLETEEAFISYLKQVGERIHLQPALAVWNWLGLAQIEKLTRDPEIGRLLLHRSRSDQLARIIAEVGADHTSRRAVTASFVYPEFDQCFEPMYGIPPYQSFQLLPTTEPDEPLCSMHVHRSLDATHGVELDFHHDLRWLSQAAKMLNRPIGHVSVVAANLHVYVGTEESKTRLGLEDWLLRVTDGYRVGSSQVSEILQQNTYRRNIQRIYDRLRG